MILETLEVDAATLEARRRWAIKPEGVCKGDRCVPLPTRGDETVDVRVRAERPGMPLIEDATVKPNARRMRLCPGSAGSRDSEGRR